MDAIAQYLKWAREALQWNEPYTAIAYLNAALVMARKLRWDVPRNRCLRAYIVQAIGALSQ